MGNPFTEPTIGNDYRSNEPPDDDTQSSANAVSWSKHVNKIAEPLKTYIDSLKSNVTTAFSKIFLNNVSTISTTYTVQTSDRGKLLETTGAITVTLLAAGTAGSGFVVSFRNTDANDDLTIDGNSSETINGATTLKVPPRTDVILTTDGSSWSALVMTNDKPLASGAISDQASLEFTNLNTAYVKYELVLTDLLPATDNVDFICRTSTDNGANFDSGATDYDWARGTNLDTGTSGAAGSSGDSEIILSATCGNGGDEQVSGTIEIMNPADTTETAVISMLFSKTQNNVYILQYAGGQRNVAAATDAIQFKFSSGNISTATYALYARRASA